MTLDSIFEAIPARALVFGLMYAVFEMQRMRRQRKREAALAMLHTFQSPDFAKSLHLVYQLPGGFNHQQIEERLAEDFHYVHAGMATWESTGVLLYRGELKFDLVDDFLFVSS